MTLSYKMPLLMFLAEAADASGKVSLRGMAERFQSFFVDRAVQGKAEENPNVVQAGVLAGRNLSEWERTVVDQPLRYINPGLVVRVNETDKLGSPRISNLVGSTTRRTSPRSA